ncbi:50S ribosomal protein L32 [Patescibacteria group bacterium]|nr:MAG: 50S ribosomal protein L32 [Patescibacteria group bacterium]
MAVPKQKTPRSRRGQRRSHQGLKESLLSVCPKCKEPRLSHMACMECGYYNGEEVIKIETLQERKKRQEDRDSRANK